MAVAWLVTIASFILFYYTTSVIMDGLREREQYELSILDDQIQSNFANHSEIPRKASQFVFLISFTIIKTDCRTNAAVFTILLKVNCKFLWYSITQTITDLLNPG